MNVVYTFDDAYAEITGVSIISLLENNKNTPIIIYVVDCGISVDNKQKLKNVCDDYKTTIVFLPSIDIKNRISVDLNNAGWSDVCYVRLFYASIIPCDVDKALHIDCDTIVRKNLSQIYNLDLKDNYCAACHDCYPKPRRQIEMGKGLYYISNGLILMNLKKWRDDDVESQFIGYIENRKGILPHLDQDVLNYVCSDKIEVLPAKYNVMTHTLMYGELCCGLFTRDEPYYSREEIEQAVADPGVVHFTGSRYARRPWQQPSAHWYNKEWMDYYKKADYSLSGKLITVRRKYAFLKHIYSLFWIKACRFVFIRRFRFFLDRKLLWKI